jgi:addiction module HigA family antidote
MPMKNPPHPGEIIRDLYLEPLGLTATEAAAGLGVTRKTLLLLVNGHAGISPEMATQLSKAFGRTPEAWLQLQMQYDLARYAQSTESQEQQP